MRLLICIALIAISLQGQGRNFELKPSGTSRMELRVFKTGLYRGKVHTFIFPKFEGSLVYDPQHPESSSVRLRIDTRAITLTDTWLNAKDFQAVEDYALHDMLDTARHPEITFESSSVRQNSAGGFDVTGTLTIRGVSKPCLVHAKVGGSMELNGSAQVKLTDYKLKPPSAALGTIGTKDEMEFSFVIQAG